MASRTSFTAGDVTTDQSGNVTPGRTAKLGNVADVEAPCLPRDEEDIQQSLMASRLPDEPSSRSRWPLPVDDGGAIRREPNPRPSSAESPTDPHVPSRRQRPPKAGLPRE